MTKIDRIMEIIKDYSYLKEDLNAFQFTYSVEDSNHRQFRQARMRHLNLYMKLFSKVSRKHYNRIIT